jgi:hypothetical protein
MGFDRLASWRHEKGSPVEGEPFQHLEHALERVGADTRGALRPIVLDLVQGAAELAETTDYDR